MRNRLTLLKRVDNYLLLLFDFNVLKFEDVKDVDAQGEEKKCFRFLNFEES